MEKGESTQKDLHMSSYLCYEKQTNKKAKTIPCL